jgi:parallel beta-helix repeat protein
LHYNGGDIKQTGLDILKVLKFNPDSFMKIKIAIAAIVSSSFILHSAFGQGALTPPPGAPAPTMLTLSQIEPRTPVDAVHTPGNNDAEFIISQPGSYYLTTNILGGVSTKTGIEILTNNVTLDLNGFSLLGSSSAISGIYIAAATNITVRNGTISGWANGYYGISCVGQDATFDRLTISGNTYGIYCANDSVISDCAVIGNRADGIAAGNNCIVSGCMSANNQGNGILLNSASGCLITGNIVAGNDAGLSANTAGICVIGSNNRIEGNHVTGTVAPGNGILIFINTSYTNNIVIRNSVEGGGAANYSVNAGINDIGPIGPAATNSSPWGNISH